MFPFKTFRNLMNVGSVKCSLVDARTAKVRHLRTTADQEK